MAQRFANQFLIPLPIHEGSYFDGSLTFICDHSEEGAIGLIVNRPTEYNLNTLLEAADLNHELDPAPTLFEGGPVHPGAPCILHTDDSLVDCTMLLADTSGLAFTPASSMTDFVEMLNRIANQDGPSKYLVAIGYAGWHDGQLENEVNQNVWLTCPGSADILFDTAIELRADLAAEAIGVDLSLLSGNSDGIA